MKKMFVAFMMVMAVVFGMAIGPEEALAREPQDAGFSYIEDKRYDELADNLMEDLEWIFENNPENPIDVVGYGFACTDECIELYLDYIDPETGETLSVEDDVDYDDIVVTTYYTHVLRMDAELTNNWMWL